MMFLSVKYSCKVLIQPGVEYGISMTQARICLQDGSCGSGDHPSDHDAQFGCAEVNDLPSSTLAFVLKPLGKEGRQVVIEHENPIAFATEVVPSSPSC